MDYFGYRDAVYASNLTAHQKLVALVIAYHYNWKEQTPAFPSNSTISRETSLSISTIVRAKKVLVEKGWVVIQRRWDGPCDYTPCSAGATNNEVNNEVNNEYINNNKKIPKIDIEIQEYNQVEDSALVNFKEMAGWQW